MKTLILHGVNGNACAAAGRIALNRKTRVDSATDRGEDGRPMGRQNIGSVSSQGFPEIVEICGTVRPGGRRCQADFLQAIFWTRGESERDFSVVISPTMWLKTKAPVLGDFEQLVLLGVLRLELQDSAYGAAIRQEIHARSGRDVSINAVYTTLDRLEGKSLLRSWVGDPTPQRGGRRRKFYAVRPAGVAALRQAYRAFTAMADGLQSRLELK
jgi:PadR family transcriptional regulator, regulatory protein PadR